MEQDVGKKLVDELQKHLDEMSAKLDEANKRAAENAANMEALAEMSAKLDEANKRAAENAANMEALAEMSANLEEANGRAERAENMEAETARDRDSLKREMQGLRRQMQNNLNEYEEGKKTDHNKWIEALAELEEVKEKLETAEENETATAQLVVSLRLQLQNKLEEYEEGKKKDFDRYAEELEHVKETAEENEAAMSQKLREASEDNKILRERVEELMRKLAESEALQQPQMQQPDAVQQRPQLQRDIFQMFREHTKETMTIADAVYSLNYVVGSGDKQWRSEYEKAMDDEDMSLKCEMCEKTLTKYEIIDHFVSADHCEKTRQSGAAYVSRAAHGYWKRKMDAIPEPMVIAKIQKMSDYSL